MFNDDTLEKFFAHKEMQSIPVGLQSTIVNIVEEILQSIMEENQYVTVAELFVSTTNE